MARLTILMIVLYATQAACSNPGIAYLSVANYLINDLKFSATQLAKFQFIAFLPWFCKPIFGFLIDAFPLLGYKLKSYLLICFLFVIFAFIGLSFYSYPSSTVLLSGILTISTGIAFSDVLADRCMVTEGNKHNKIDILQATQWIGLGFAAILTFITGGWLADKFTISIVFLLSIATPAIGFLSVFILLKEKPNSSVTFIESWYQFLQVFRKLELRQILFLILLIKISPIPIDYIYQRKVLEFDNALIGNLNAFQYLGVLIGAVAFVILSRYSSKKLLLTYAVLGNSMAILSLAFMQDATTAYSVYLVRGFMSTIGFLGLFGVVARVCPKGAEGSSYALIVSIFNLASSVGLLLGGWFYDVGLTFSNDVGLIFSTVAILGATYALICGSVIMFIHSS